MITFKLAEHSIIPDKKVVELWDGKFLVGTIYAEPRGLKINSKFFMDTSSSKRHYANITIQSLTIFIDAEPLAPNVD